MDLEIKGEAEQGIHDSGFLSIKDSHFLRIVIVSKLYPSTPGVGKFFFVKGQRVNLLGHMVSVKTI